MTPWYAEPAWLVSYVLLWVLVIALAIVVLALMRLMGRMQQRLGPAPALVAQSGPKIGSSFPELSSREGVFEDGVLRFPKTRDTLLVFLSPGCSACEDLMPALLRFREFHKSEIEIIPISTSGRREHNKEFAEREYFRQLELLIIPNLAGALGILTTPYVLWLDEEGTIRAKGLATTLEHLESLRNARQLGVATASEYRLKAQIAVGG